MCIFKNKNVKYFKSPNTVRHENHDFFENKNSLQCKNPLKTILGILFFYAFRSNNTPTVSHQKFWGNHKKYCFLYKCLWKSLSGYLTSAQKIIMRSILKCGLCVVKSNSRVKQSRFNQFWGSFSSEEVLEDSRDTPPGRVQALLTNYSRRHACCWSADCKRSFTVQLALPLSYVRATVASWYNVRPLRSSCHHCSAKTCGGWPRAC